jgi:hypothetical protein
MRRYLESGNLVVYSDHGHTILDKYSSVEIDVILQKLMSGRSLSGEEESLLDSRLSQSVKKRSFPPRPLHRAEPP